MSKQRQLHVEIERTLKLVEDGHDLFLQYFRKFQATQPGSQKDKFEREMGKEIKKLQRYRDSIRGWVGNQGVKDKNLLLEAKRKIEQQMEAFKACEKETKTKTYSREGLEASNKLDPAEEEKAQMRDWVQDTQQKLVDQINILDSELESISSKKVRDTDAMDHLQSSLDKLKYHYDKLDLLLRKSENEGCVNSEKFQELQEVFECFIAADFNDECEDSFVQVYSDLDILKNVSTLGSNGSVEDDSGSVHSDSTVSSKKPAAKKTSAAELQKRAPPPTAVKIEVKTEERQGREVRQPPSVWDAPSLSRCNSAPVHDKQLPDKSPVLEKPSEKLVVAPADRPADKPSEKVPSKPGLKALLSKLQSESEPVLTDEQDMEGAQEHIDTSFFYAIRSDDRARPSLIVLNSPFPCHPSFPKCPLFREAERIRQMDLDTLFFIFYHQPGTYQQYLAARYLQSKNWQYHRKEQTWFQREDSARGKTPGKGTYFYFDYTASWSQRIRQDFVFEAQHLETVSSD